MVYALEQRKMILKMVFQALSVKDQKRSEQVLAFVPKTVDIFLTYQDIS